MMMLACMSLGADLSNQIVGLLSDRTDADYNITNTTFTDGSSFFWNYDGLIVGAPASINDGNLMFYGTTSNVNLSGCEIKGDSTNMFQNASGNINLGGATITNADKMFYAFTGTSTGIPLPINSASYMFSNSSAATVDLRGWTLNNTEYMFQGASAVVYLAGTTINTTYKMFNAFNGTVSGIPAQIGSAEAMFAYSNTDVNLTGWNLISSTRLMFQSATGAVNINAASISNGGFMFSEFTGTVSGIPSQIGSAKYMFFKSNSTVNLTGWSLTSSTESMFWDATGAVNIDGVDIADGYYMFGGFTGTVSGIPTQIGSAERMFEDSSANVDLTGWSFPPNTKFMFRNAFGAVNIDGVDIADGYYMFEGFTGTVSGIPTYIGAAEGMFVYSNSTVNLTGWGTFPLSPPPSLPPPPPSAVWPSSTEYMFQSATGAVNIDGVAITNGNYMFREFTGTVSGIPAQIGSAGSMFESSNTNVNLTGWNLTESTALMFQSATGAVDIGGAFIANGHTMFWSFTGTVSGIPAQIGSAASMFESSNASVTLTGWNLTESTATMFQSATGAVDIGGASITNGNYMFRYFTGTVSGIPSQIGSAEYMFAYSSEHVDLENWNTQNSKNMFAFSGAAVSINNFTTENAEFMFEEFTGTLTGTPNYIGNANHMFASSNLDLDLTNWTSSAEYMFNNASSNIILDGFTIVNGTRIFYGLRGNITGTPNFDPNQFETLFDQTSHITVTDFLDPEDYDLSFYPHITFICGNSVCQRKSPKNPPPLSDLALALIIVGSVFLLAGIGFWVKKNGYEALPDQVPIFR
jgi:hypothetical protein